VFIDENVFIRSSGFTKNEYGERKMATIANAILLVELGRNIIMYVLMLLGRYKLVKQKYIVDEHEQQK
jgi:hypothetical protein